MGNRRGRVGERKKHTGTHQSRREREFAKQHEGVTPSGDQEASNCDPNPNFFKRNGENLEEQDVRALRRDKEEAEGS